MATNNSKDGKNGPAKAKRVKSSGSAPEVPTSMPGDRFSDIFLQYLESIRALREFFKELTPVVVGLDEQSNTELRRQKLLERAAPDAIQEMEEFFRTLSTNVAAREIDRTEWTFTPEHPETSQLILDLIEASQPMRRSSFSHRQLLHRGILMSLVGFFEVLIADLVHAYYNMVPEAAANEEKVLSLNELRSFASVDDAIRQVVSHKVDELLRGSLDDWNKFFLSRMNVELSKLLNEKDAAQWHEIFQRRHVIVHAGAKASKRYIQSIDWDLIDWPEKRPDLEDSLVTDDGYISYAVSIFEVVGSLLSQSVWRKMAKADTPRRLGSLNMQGIYDCLLRREWGVAERLAAWGLADKEGSEMDTLMFRFNRWQAIKRQDRWAEIEEEVESFDCSAKAPQFVLAWLSLREKTDDFFQLAPKSLASGITKEQFNEWPIFEEMRKDPRFAELTGEPATDEVSDASSESSLTVTLSGRLAKSAKTTGTPQKVRKASRKESSKSR